MLGEMRQRWCDLLHRWAVDLVRAEERFDEVRRLYAGPGRFYHTIGHVRDVLETVERLSGRGEHPDAVRLAGWLNDVVYDSRASDNEERSAEYAERLCKKLSMPEGREVASLILNTKTHEAGDDPDAQVLIDADLAILGASESGYRAYADQIRQEYAW